MALKFRLRGLAETFIEKIRCPGCGHMGSDDESFATELTKVTFEGIIVVAQCRSCSEIFVPESQRRGVMDPAELKKAVERDCDETGEPLYSSMESVVLNAERLNAMRKGELH